MRWNVFSTWFNISTLWFLILSRCGGISAILHHQPRFQFYSWKILAALLRKLNIFSERYPLRFFVNLGYCPCKSVKKKNDLTSSKIDIIEQNLDRKRLLKWLFDLYWKGEKFEKFPIFPDFLIFPKKRQFWKFWKEIPDRDTQCQTHII